MRESLYQKDSNIFRKLSPGVADILCMYNYLLCTIINVICVMQSMSATPAGIYTNVLTNTVIQQ